MSDGFSWAPFGPSRDDEVEPLPPLPPLEEDAAAQPPPAPLPPDIAPEALPFEIQEDLPLPPVSAGAPPALVPSTPPAITVAPEKRQRPQVRGGGDASAAFIWGILGVTVCPVLLPSIAAVRLAKRARTAGGGLDQKNLGLANAGAVLGWIGIAIWAIVIMAVIASS